MLGEVGRIPKRGVNEFHGYSYVTEADLVDAIRPLMAKVGIVIVPSVIEHTYTPNAATTRRGGSLARTNVMVHYTVTDGHGQLLEFNMPGESFDDADKGVYKALTGSMKYALMKLCMVSTGDDPEGDRKVDDVEVRIESSDQRAAKGGHEEGVTLYQMQRISVAMRERRIPRSILAGALEQYLGESEKRPEYESEQWQPWVITQLQRLTNRQAGSLIEYLETLEFDPDATA